MLPDGGRRLQAVSAANNGPTAWIDSCGRIVKRLETGTNGHLIASPTRDSRISWVRRLGRHARRCHPGDLRRTSLCVRKWVPHTAQTPDGPDSKSAESCELTAES